MSLAQRWSICFPVLEAVLGDDLTGIALTFAEDGMIVVRLDGDGTAFGFVEGLPGESLVDAAERFLGVLYDELPLSARGWGRQVLPCAQPGHRHPLAVRPDLTTSALVLFCPDDPTAPVRRIELLRL